MNTPRFSPRRHIRFKLRLAALVCIGASALPSEAHDTWFELLPADRAAPATQITLGTGNRYPLMETGVDIKYLARQGCWVTGASANEQPLTRLRDNPKSLLLQTPAAAQSCWAQLQPFDLQIDADKVALYLREIQAPASVKQAWASQKAAGVVWAERYTKYARIALQPAGLQQPSPMGMDLLVQAPGADPNQPLRAGDTLQVQLLRGGQPVAGQALELQNASTGVAAGTGRNLGGAVGLWRRTDAEGRASWPALSAGAWLVRGTDLRLAAPNASHGQRWESDFITLAFSVEP